MTSFALIVIRRKDLADLTILLRRQILPEIIIGYNDECYVCFCQHLMTINLFYIYLLNKAAKQTEKPIAMSQRTIIQAMLHPFTDAMFSSMLRGRIAVPIMNVPTQIRIKKGGCDAMTTANFRLITTQMSAPVEDTRMIDIRMYPIIRILLSWVLSLFGLNTPRDLW